MAFTFKAIATVTVGSGGASSIDFTSIPATYTDLLIMISARGANTAANNGHYYSISINNSSSNLTQRYLQGTGSTVQSGSSSTTTGNYMPASDYTANTFSNNLTYFPNYGGSNNKSFSTDSNANSTNSSTDSRAPRSRPSSRIQYCIN